MTKSYPPINGVIIPHQRVLNRFVEWCPVMEPSSNPMDRTMSHPVQISKSTTIERRQSLLFAGGRTQYGQELADANVVRGRAASTLNRKDSTGWRDPGSYWGYEGYSKPGWVSYGTLDGSFRLANWPLQASVITSYDYPSSWKDSAYQRALLKFKHRNLNLAVSVGEIRETHRMLRSTCLALVKMAVAIRKGQIRQVGRLLKESARPVDLWLQARYGWMPLLSDLHGAVDSLQQRLSHPAKGDGITARARNIVGQRVSNPAFAGLYPTALWYDEVVDRGFVCRVRLDARVVDVHFRDLVDTGIQDPLLVAWNLLGGSFVVDWVFGVGKYLDGLNALAGLSFKGGSETVRYSVQRYWVNPRFVHPNYVVHSFESPKWELTRFDRGAVVVPNSRIVTKGFDGVSNVNWVDAASLLYQVLHKRIYNRPQL